MYKNKTVMPVHAIASCSVNEG